MYDITITVPTFNSETYLETTLFSLVHQKGIRLEIIVADSGSTDKTLEICKKYAIRTIFVHPGNLYLAVNRALSVSTSPWLSYLNSDDIVYPASYARLVDYGESQNADIVYGSYDFIDNESRFIHSFWPGKPSELRSCFLTSQISFVQPAAIFRNKVFSQLNGFNEEFTMASDLDFYFRAIMQGYQFAMLKGKTVCGFRITSTQLSQNTSKMKDQANQVSRKFGKPSIRDYWSTSLWKIRNWPNYLMRLLRFKALTTKYGFVHTIDIYKPEY